jgi:Uma2 family endonuclease
VEFGACGRRDAQLFSGDAATWYPFDLSTAANPLMTVDEFLAWAEGRDGRWELHDGEFVAIAPQSLAHLDTKHEVVTALKSAIRRAQAPCHAVPDGATVRIAAGAAFEPAALVYCGPRLPPDAIEIPGPVIVVEVVSEGTAARDHGPKLAGYFSLPSVAHYLILDADNRMAIHHKRGLGDVIETRILKEGQLRLDPPGLGIPVQDLLAQRTLLPTACRRITVSAISAGDKNLDFQKNNGMMITFPEDRLVPTCPLRSPARLPANR